MILLLESCFIDKRYGPDNKKAKDLILQPLFDQMQNSKDRVSRQSTCIALKMLNAKYSTDPDIVSIGHCLTFVMLGVKHKIYDGEFLMAIVDLLNEHGLSVALGQSIPKAVPHFIQSIKFNQTGQNADNKVHRDQHLCASLTVLIVLANSCFNSLEHAITVSKNYTQAVVDVMSLVSKESQQVQGLSQQCIQTWMALQSHARDLEAQSYQSLNNTEQQIPLRHQATPQFEQDPTTGAGSNLGMNNSAGNTLN